MPGVHAEVLRQYMIGRSLSARQKKLAPLRFSAFGKCRGERAVFVASPKTALCSLRISTPEIRLSEGDSDMRESSKRECVTCFFIHSTGAIKPRRTKQYFTGL